jgi:biopolymer transport protein ExbD
MAMSVGSGGDGEEASVMAEINTTPLVDIMLVLLIIFLITVPVIQDLAHVTIPKAANIPTQTKPENITILVDATGQVYWNAGKITDKQVFFQKIVSEARKKPQPEFHIRGDKDARFEAVGRVMYNLQRGGIVKVGFITEPDAASIHITR